MPRMRILNAVEQHDFDSPPMFNSLQRKKYFDFSLTLYQMVAGLRSPAHQVGFLISCGYFQATKKFFPAGQFRSQDIEYVANKLGLSAELVQPNEYPDRARQRHQQTILKFYGYRAFDRKAKAFVTEEINAMIRSQLKPRLIFWRCIDLLLREKIQLPNCFTLTDLISSAINEHKKTLTLLQHQLTAELREALDALFENRRFSILLGATMKIAIYMPWLSLLTNTIACKIIWSMSCWPVYAAIRTAHSATIKISVMLNGLSAIRWSKNCCVISTTTFSACWPPFKPSPKMAQLQRSCHQVPFVLNTLIFIEKIRLLDRRNFRVQSPL